MAWLLVGIESGDNPIRGHIDEDDDSDDDDTIVVGWLTQSTTIPLGEASRERLLKTCGRHGDYCKRAPVYSSSVQYILDGNTLNIEI